jgi:hypothetical protein
VVEFDRIAIGSADITVPDCGGPLDDFFESRMQGSVRRGPRS